MQLKGTRHRIGWSGSGLKPGLPPWGPHVRFRRMQALVREGVPLVKLRNSALVALPVPARGAVITHHEYQVPRGNLGREDRGREDACRNSPQGRQRSRQKSRPCGGGGVVSADGRLWRTRAAVANVSMVAWADWRSSATDARRVRACLSTPSVDHSTRRSRSWRLRNAAHAARVASRRRCT